MPFRLLHVVIFIGLGILALKIADMAHRGQDIKEALFVETTRAASEEAKEGEAKKEDAPAAGEAAKMDEKKDAAPKDKAAEESKDKAADASKDKAEAEAETDADEEGGEEGVKKLSEDELIFTETEVEVLKRLKQRREKLGQWEEELRVKDNVLRITQTKIDQKLQELRNLKKEVQELLVQYNEKEDAKLRSLVKIYENMKPGAAAKVFEDLDMSVLLQVVDRMKEAKSAPILAKMSPQRAKELTVLYAEQRKLTNPDAIK